MKTLKFIITLLFIFPIIYSGAWFYLAQELKKQVHNFYEIDGPVLGYEFYGEKPEVSGFPTKPIVTYKDGFARDGVTFKFDELTISAFPFPSQPLDIDISNLAIQSTPSGQLYEINTIDATVIIPKSFPADMTYAEVSKWQKDVKQLDFKSIELTKNSMEIKASGPVGLDNNLQPSLDLKSKMVGYDKLIRFMAVETNEISPLAANIATAILNNMAEEDAVTGEKSVTVDIVIRDRRLIFGPAKTIKIPKVTWPQTLP